MQKCLIRPARFGTLDAEVASEGVKSPHLATGWPSIWPESPPGLSRFGTLDAEVGCAAGFGTSDAMDSVLQMQKCQFGTLNSVHWMHWAIITGLDSVLQMQKGRPCRSG